MTQLTTLQLTAMTLPFSLKLVTLTPLPEDQRHHYQQVIGDFLNHVDAAFSPFHDSLVTRYQRHQLTPAEFTPEFQEVFAWAIRAQTITQRAFNPFCAGRYDPTGLVKGWAIQTAFTRYLQPKLQSGQLVAAALNGAGDIQVGVAASHDYCWHVGVEDPHDRQRLLAQYPLRNGAMATSGTSQRGEHIYRQTPNDLEQATVLAPDLLTADIFATAAIAMGARRFTTFSATQGLSGLLYQSHHHLVTLEGGIRLD